MLVNCGFLMKTWKVKLVLLYKTSDKLDNLITCIMIEIC